MPTLAALASAVGATRRIELKRGWTEPSVLWCVVVSRSGTLKTPAWSYALDIIRRHQAWSLEEMPELIEQYQRDLMLYKADLTTWTRKGRAAGEPPPEKPVEPTPRRYLVNDITIEALADRLLQAPRGLLLGTDEARTWLGGFDAHRSAGRGADAAKWLSIHRAEFLLLDRKTGAIKTVFVKRAAVSIAGAITPGAFRQAMGVEHVENGLMARLLLAMPPVEVKKWSEATASPATIRRMEILFGRLLALDFGVDADDSPAPIDVRLTAGAKDLFVRFYNEHAKRQADAPDALAAACAKLEATAARHG